MAWRCYPGFSLRQQALRPPAVVASSSVFATRAKRDFLKCDYRCARAGRPTVSHLSALTYPWRASFFFMGWQVVSPEQDTLRPLRGEVCLDMAGGAVRRFDTLDRRVRPFRRGPGSAGRPTRCFILTAGTSQPIQQPRVPCRCSVSPASSSARYSAPRFADAIRSLCYADPC